MTIPYLIYSSILIAIFYCLYHLLLRKETFFGINRYILIFGILCSFILPVIPTPIKISVTETIIESQSFQMSEINFIGNNNNSARHLSPLPNDSPTNNQVSIQTATSNNNIKIIPLIYVVGVSILLLNLLIQLSKIIYTILRYDKKDKIILLPYDRSPSSFFNYVFVGQNSYPESVFNHIINHEKVHSDQKHTLDIILAELLIIVQWFNPFAWLYRRAIEKNLEFIVDDEMLTIVESKKQYQYNLLHLAVKNFPLSVVTNYNQSLIKTRIKMMNTKKSSLKQSWKYILFIPIIFTTIFLFNPTNVGSIAFNNEVKAPIMLIVNANATQSDLDRIQKDAASLGYQLSYSNIKWDANNQLKNYSSYLSSTCGTIGNVIGYTDINRHKPTLVFQSEFGATGFVNEGPLSTELFEKLFENIPAESKASEMASTKVVTSFTDQILSYADFIQSVDFTSEKNLFEKERNWQEIFQEDRANNVNSFNYFINEKPTTIEKLKPLMELQEVRDIVISENNFGKDDFAVFTVPFTGFQSEGSTTTQKSQSRTYEGFKGFANFLIEESIVKHPGSKLKYFYEGLEQEDLLNTIDSTSFNSLTIETGNNFDRRGKHLGYEIRIHFKK